jgi:TolB-like protein/Tfp pilus assembly protein PilF
MSGDSEQEYFADGISEDIITGLSKLRWFFVIARNSSFAYKGKAVDVKRAARELGVRYVLEGSVRRSSNRVRITAQLIDAATGNHIWADRYDGELADVFELQDEITKKVIAAIEPKLLEAEGLRSHARSPEDLGAWDLLMQANSVFWRMTRADIDAAIVTLKKATERYPDYAPAQSMLAFALLFRAIHMGAYRSQDLRDALQLASRAAELDDGDPWAHLALGWAALLTRQTETAVEEYHRALGINPNFAAAHGHLGMVYGLDDQPDKAIIHLDQATLISPHDPQTFLFNTNLAIAHYMADRYDEAVAYGRKAVQQRSSFTPGLRIYAASLAQKGEIKEAGQILDQLKILQPETSIAWIVENTPYKPQAMAKLVAGLRRAGLD